MSQDPRCCGSGTCIIDIDGRCWCGQQWDGRKMCQAPLAQAPAPAPAPAAVPADVAEQPISPAVRDA
jgi:hypothetical protein